jgi:hypothetical protein
VGLYDVFETRVINDKAYANPFDASVIELRATFRSPSGRRVEFFGFYDGDGEGGQTGDVWKLRFMPDEAGTWTYAYTWSDGTPGGEGSFEVEDTGLAGPLRIASDNPWYFMDSRGRPFHWRGYDLHVIAPYTRSRSFLSELDHVKNLIRTRVVERGYNVTMWAGLINRRRLAGRRDFLSHPWFQYLGPLLPRLRRTLGAYAGRVNPWKESWWLDAKDTRRFDLAAWHAYEDALTLAKDSRVYVLPFAGMIHQGDIYDLRDFKVFLRYWTARFGAFYNFFGWSPTWEWTDVWTPEEVNAVMGYLREIDPFPTLLSVHDCSHSSFSKWLSFSMRQAQSRTVFDGNSRTAGQRQGSCDGEGGVGAPFVDKPIVGSEDIWESEWGKFGHPRNATEVRRAAWGVMMAGVLPLYSEWHPNPPPPGGKGTGEPEVRRMFDFFYGKTRYRRYRQLNDLVSRQERQVASGIPGREYLVYDEDGGPVGIDLSGAPSAARFSTLWFDPATGTEKAGPNLRGGARRSLDSPFEADTVLLLRRLSDAESSGRD